MINTEKRLLHYTGSRFSFVCKMYWPRRECSWRVRKKRKIQFSKVCHASLCCSLVVHPFTLHLLPHLWFLFSEDSSRNAFSILVQT
jgi:hypothetical protein